VNCGRHERYGPTRTGQITVGANTSRVGHDVRSPQRCGTHESLGNSASLQRFGCCQRDPGQVARSSSRSGRTRGQTPILWPWSAGKRGICLEPHIRLIAGETGQASLALQPIRPRSAGTVSSHVSPPRRSSIRPEWIVGRSDYRLLDRARDNRWVERILDDGAGDRCRRTQDNHPKLRRGDGSLYSPVPPSLH